MVVTRKPAITQPPLSRQEQAAAAGAASFLDQLGVPLESVALVPEKATGGFSSGQLNGERYGWVKNPHFEKLTVGDRSIMRQGESWVLILDDPPVDQKATVDEARAWLMHGTLPGKAAAQEQGEALRQLGVTESKVPVGHGDAPADTVKNSPLARFDLRSDKAGGE